MDYTIVVESYHELLTNYQKDWERLQSDHPVLKKKRFDLEWIQLKYSQGFGQPVIFVHTQKDQVSGFAVFYLHEVDFNRQQTYHEDGTRTFEQGSGSVLHYKKALLIGEVMGISSNFMSDIMDSLFHQYGVDIISMSVYADSFARTMGIFADDPMPFKIIGQKTCDLFGGEIGHHSADSMRIVLPGNLEELLLPFRQKHSHQYNIRNVERVFRKASRHAQIDFKPIVASSDVTDTMIRQLVDELVSVDQNSWQGMQKQPHLSLFGRDDLTEKLTYLFKHHGLVVELMYADRIPISYMVGIRFDKYISEFWLGYHQDYGYLSPGKLVFFKFIETCIELNLAEIECSGTLHKYKTDIVNQTEPAYEIAIFNQTSGGKLLHRIKRSFPTAFF